MALATRKSISLARDDFPNSQGKQAKNPAPHAQILGIPASRGAVKSRIPSRYLSFSRFPNRILVKSWIPKILFQTLDEMSIF